ncbi:MAG: hypothetical protein JWP38_3303 [Herbaspirillum sp.]|jgi:hypothetical protein|nr:hypothetical protein [Herbaspirillum sp.]
MCGLCGMLGGEAHWSDAGRAASDEDLTRTRHRERQLRVAQLNRVLRGFSCTVSDWQGHAYLLSTLTGNTEIIDNLAQLWPAVERLSGRIADPLAADVLARLQPAS